MIKEVISLLPLVKDETENIRIAKAKNKLSESFFDGYKNFKIQLKQYLEENKK